MTSCWATFSVKVKWESGDVGARVCCYSVRWTDVSGQSHGAVGKRANWRLGVPHIQFRWLQETQSLTHHCIETAVCGTLDWLSGPYIGWSISIVRSQKWAVQIARPPVLCGVSVGDVLSYALFVTVRDQSAVFQLKICWHVQLSCVLGN
jgi:hypothetical protein